MYLQRLFLVNLSYPSPKLADKTLFITPSIPKNALKGKNNLNQWNTVLMCSLVFNFPTDSSLNPSLYLWSVKTSQSTQLSSVMFYHQLVAFTLSPYSAGAFDYKFSEMSSEYYSEDISENLLGSFSTAVVYVSVNCLLEIAISLPTHVSKTIHSKLPT